MVIYQPVLHSSEDYDNDDGVDTDDDDHYDDHDDVDKEFDDSGIQRAGQTAICCCSKYPRVVTACSSVGCLKCVQFHNWFRLH